MPSTWITLPSNDQNAVGTSGHFTIQLSKPIYFDKKHELALRQFTFLNEWDNVFEDRNFFYISVLTKRDKHPNDKLTVITVTVPPGYYDAEGLTKTLNISIKEATDAAGAKHRYDGSNRGTKSLALFTYNKVKKNWTLAF